MHVLSYRVRRIAFSLITCLSMIVISRSVFADTSASAFKAKCAICHGADGKGNTVIGKKMGAPDLASATVQKQSDAELANAIAKGKNKMPAMGSKLSREEIKGLVTYVRQLGKAR